MAKFVGRLLQLGIAKEGTRGAGAASTYMLPNTSFSFDDKIVQARSVGALGKLADSEEAFVGPTQFIELSFREKLFTRAICSGFKNSNFPVTEPVM